MNLLRVTRLYFTVYAKYGKVYTKCATTFSIATLSITTFTIMTLSIKGLFVTLSINDIQHN